ncbi:MAG TPA: T9SS type A sorting domain-containing protein, partial [Saprospiraceae bacterium]|nr:T9SS type A sorting domain-containing protein [Saprospiraceae bacterium]
LFCVFSSEFFAQPGTLDPSFGSSGKVTADFANDEDRAYAVAVQPDGKIVAAGWADSGFVRNLAVLRLNSDGSPDTEFGINGKYKTSLLNNCRAIAIQPDGKILVAGSDGSQAVYVARLLSNGTPDTGFGINGVSGVLISSFGVGIYAMLLQPNGRIVIGGYTYNGTTVKDEFLLVRFNSVGTVDGSFGTGGIVKTSFGSSVDDVWAIGLDLQPDGKILATGFAQINNNYDVSLARYNPDGSLDNTFSGDGKATTELGSNSDEAESVFVLPDGKIAVLANTVQNGNYTPTLIRYQANSSLDNSFGTNGLAFFPLPVPAGGVLRGIRQPDGKIVGAGFSNGAGLIRLNSDGTPDQSFGSGGFVMADAEVLRGVALQPDGKIVAAGNVDNDFVVLRYLSGLSVDTQEPGDTLYFSIQPNPASDFIEIKTNETVGRADHISLFDSNGRLLRSAGFENTVRWDVHSLPAGVYQVHIQGAGRSWMKNFVKQ